MQTFLPFPDFDQCAKVLDYRRLGKQRVEAYQIWQTLTGVNAGWQNHPAVKMWRGFESALLFYHDIIIKEWVARGYNNNMLLRAEELSFKLPPWLGDERLHKSHRSNLVRKLPTHYGNIFTDVDGNLPYYWPCI